MSGATDLVSYLDRRVTDRSSGVTISYTGGVTTWTLPYSVPTDGTEGALAVCTYDYPVLLTSTRPAANQIAVAGDYRGRNVYLGVLYPFRYVPSQVVRRDPQGNAVLGGRVSLLRLSVLYAETTNLTATVRRTLRAATASSVSKFRASAGKLLALIQLWANETRVEISTLSPGAVALSGLVWEGEHYDVERTS